MLNRRSFLGICAVSLFSKEADARDVGLSVSPNIQKASEDLSYVEEGTGQGVLHILYTPWCHAVPEFYATTRPFVSQMKLRWIPFSGGQIEGKNATENLLETGDPTQIPLNFPVIGTSETRVKPTPLSDAQDAKMEKFNKVLIMETSHQIYIPTMLYRRVDDRFRIIRGSINGDDLNFISKVAG